MTGVAEKPRADNQVEQGWEVYPSCDVKLGEVFRNHPEFPDAYIDINTDAAAEILKSMSSASTEGTELRFEVAPADSNELAGKGATGYYLKQTQPKKKKTADSIEESLSDIPKCVIGVDAKSAIDGFGGLRTIKDQELHFPSLDMEQETVVHELRHAADFTEPELLDKQSRYNMKNAVAIGAGTGLGSFITLVAFEHGMKPAFEGLGADDPFKSILALGVGVLATVAWIKPTFPKMMEYADNRRNHKSPMEQRAYATAASAFQHPTVIRVWTD